MRRKSVNPPWPEREPAEESETCTDLDYEASQPGPVGTLVSALSAFNLHRALIA
jgi:hypothetical protein